MSLVITLLITGWYFIGLNVLIRGWPMDFDGYLVLNKKESNYYYSSVYNWVS